MSMTTVFIIAGGWFLVAVVFCLAICKAASRPLPAMPVEPEAAEVAGEEDARSRILERAA
jgi:hypothetical protein